MAIHESLHVLRLGRFANGVRHVDREKIRWRAINRSTVSRRIWSASTWCRFFPAERLHRRVRLRPKAGGFSADEKMLAIGFIPDRNDVRSLVGGKHARLKLRLALMGETVAHPKRILAQR